MVAYQLHLVQPGPLGLACSAPEEEKPPGKDDEEQTCWTYRQNAFFEGDYPPVSD